MRYRILTLNNISARGLERLPRERYEIASDLDHPDAILVRSADMHGNPISDSVRAVGRAGAGVNNIPVAELSKRGIPVFNSPGANARLASKRASASAKRVSAISRLPQSVSAAAFPGSTARPRS